LESGSFSAISVEDLNLGNTIQTVRTAAFDNIVTDSIVIPDSCTNIESEVFPYAKVKTITLGNGITEINRVFDNSDVEKIILPNSLKTISGYAFYYCDNLKEIVIPDSVTTIEGDLIYRCPSIEHIYIGKNLISDITFYEYWNESLFKLKTVVVHPENQRYDSRNNCNCLIETVSNKIIKGGSLGFIPETITTIANYGFTSDDLQKVHIPASCTNLTG
jgi:hypothetical protein